MSDYLSSEAHHLGVDHNLLRGVEVGAALYALDHAAKGTPIGAEGGVLAQAARSGGNLVIMLALWHFLIVPYLIVTGLVFAIPTIALAELVDSHHAWGPCRVYVLLVFGASLFLWLRYAVHRWLWRGFMKPIDAKLSGRSAGRSAGGRWV